MKTKLNCAFLHLAIKHANPECNRALILEKFMEAASSGTDLIIAPEMATSGYAFDSPLHAARYAEEIDGPFIKELRGHCRETGCWVCAGMPLVGNDGGVVYNSAVIIDNYGAIRSEYHKVMAESSWAAKGVCDSSGVVTTPWGKIGVLICSDTYCGLLPRIRKLQGTDLLLVPANWPKSTLDPGRLWSVHARVNNMYVAVCNRTGKDRTLDCTPAVSCCYSPEGELLFEGQNSDSIVYQISLPLYDDKLRTAPAVPLYSASENIKFVIPETTDTVSQCGNMTIHVCNGKACQDQTVLHVTNNSGTECSEDAAIIICYGKCHKKNTMMCEWDKYSTSKLSINETISTDTSEPRILKINGINIALLSREMIQNPELIFKIAEGGCDVCAVYGDNPGNIEDVLYNCVHRMVMIYEVNDTIFIAAPPSGHETWYIKDSGNDGCCTITIPFETVRNKTWLRRLTSTAAVFFR